MWAKSRNSNNLNGGESAMPVNFAGPRKTAVMVNGHHVAPAGLDNSNAYILCQGPKLGSRKSKGIMLSLACN